MIRNMKNLVFHNKCIYNYLYLSSTYSTIIYKYYKLLNNNY